MDDEVAEIQHALQATGQVMQLYRVPGLSISASEALLRKVRVLANCRDTAYMNGLCNTMRRVLSGDVMRDLDSLRVKRPAEQCTHVSVVTIPERKALLMCLAVPRMSQYSLVYATYKTAPLYNYFKACLLLQRKQC